MDFNYIPEDNTDFFQKLENDVIALKGKDLNQKHHLAGYLEKPLPRLCRYPNHSYLVDLALQYGADPNTEGALHNAISANALESLKWLFLYDAQPNIKRYYNKIDASSNKITGRAYSTALTHAIRQSRIDCIQLLLDHQVAINETDTMAYKTPKTPLLLIIDKIVLARCAKCPSIQSWKRLAQQFVAQGANFYTKYDQEDLIKVSDQPRFAQKRIQLYEP